MGEAFWRFSLALYGRPGVAEALIALQDRTGSDVNLVLYGLWLGARNGRAMSAEELAAAKAAVAPIAGAVVTPLRRLRRQLRGEAAADLQHLRRRIAALEVAAECEAQYRLAAVVADARPIPARERLALAAANLATILGEEVGSLDAGVVCRAVGDLIRRAD